MGSTESRRPYGIAYRVNGETKKWKTFKTAEEVEVFKSTCEAGGATVVRVEHNVDGKWLTVWPPVEQPEHHTVDLSAVFSWLAVRDKVLDRDGYRCHYCGGPTITVCFLQGMEDRLNADSVVASCHDCGYDAPADVAHQDRMAA